jgi:hypothetical protein
MSVGFKQTSSLATSFADNSPRWDGRSAPHYEVWFLTLNHRQSRSGFWFRYTLEAPSAENSSPHAALWAAFFNRAAPEENFCLKQAFPIKEFSYDEGERPSVKINCGELQPARAAGRLENGSHSLSWDLALTSSEKTFHHVTPALARLVRPSSFICSPNIDARFSGHISVDGRTILLEDEPGCQSHTWGRKHVDEWVWLHSNAFESHPGSVFEGLAARVRRAGRMLPPIQSLFLRHRGEEHHFIRLRVAEQWRRHLGVGFWSFSAMNTQLYIEGAAQCRLRDMLQVGYNDPDGEGLFCANSEVANLKIRLFRRVRGLRWRHVETIKSFAAAHLEHASRQADPDVRVQGPEAGGRDCL